MSTLTVPTLSPLRSRDPVSASGERKDHRQWLPSLGSDVTHRLTMGHLLSAVPPLL